MLDKLLYNENQVKNVDEYIYKLGLIKKSNESKSYRWYRYSVTLICILYGLKAVVSLLIYLFKANQIKSYEKTFVWLGDFTYYLPRIRFHINIMIVVFILQTSSIQILHNKLLAKRNYENFNWMKPFEMVSGKLKPCESGFTSWNDVIRFVKW